MPRARQSSRPTQGRIANYATWDSRADPFMHSHDATFIGCDGGKEPVQRAAVLRQQVMISMPMISSSGQPNNCCTAGWRS